MDTTTIEPLFLAATPTAELDRFAELDQVINGLKSLVKELCQRRDDAFLDRIRESGEFTIGTVRYYIGPKKKTRCRDLGSAIRTILTATNNDEQKLLQCFASDPLKHGIVRSVLEEHGLPDMYDELFETTYEDELREGKPKLRSLDTKFVQSRTLRPAAEPSPAEEAAHAMENVPERFDGGPL